MLRALLAAALSLLCDRPLPRRPQKRSAPPRSRRPRRLPAETPKSRSGRLLASVTLADIGFAAGLRFSNLGGRPRNVRAAAAGRRPRRQRTCARRSTTSAPTRPGAAWKSWSTTAAPRRSRSTARAWAARCAFRSQRAKGRDGFFKLSFVYSGAATQDRCIDVRYVGDSLTVRPETAIEIEIGSPAARRRHHRGADAARRRHRAVRAARLGRADLAAALTVGRALASVRPPRQLPPRLRRVARAGAPRRRATLDARPRPDRRAAGDRAASSNAPVARVAGPGAGVRHARRGARRRAAGHRRLRRRRGARRPAARRARCLPPRAACRSAIGRRRRRAASRRRRASRFDELGTCRPRSPRCSAAPTSPSRSPTRDAAGRHQAVAARARRHGRARRRRRKGRGQRLRQRSPARQRGRGDRRADAVRSRPARRSRRHHRRTCASWCSGAAPRATAASSRRAIRRRSWARARSCWSRRPTQRRTISPISSRMVGERRRSLAAVARGRAAGSPLLSARRRHARRAVAGDRADHGEVQRQPDAPAPAAPFIAVSNRPPAGQHAARALRPRPRRGRRPRRARRCSTSAASPAARWRRSSAPARIPACGSSRSPPTARCRRRRSCGSIAATSPSSTSPAWRSRCRPSATRWCASPIPTRCRGSPSPSASSPGSSARSGLLVTVVFLFGAAAHAAPPRRRRERVSRCSRSRPPIARSAISWSSPGAHAAAARRGDARSPRPGTCGSPTRCCRATGSSPTASTGRSPSTTTCRSSIWCTSRPIRRCSRRRTPTSTPATLTMPWRRRDGRLVVATAEPGPETVLFARQRWGAADRVRGRRRSSTSPGRCRRAFDDALSHRAVFELAERDPVMSARHVFTPAAGRRSATALLTRVPASASRSRRSPR